MRNRIALALVLVLALSALPLTAGAARAMETLQLITKGSSGIGGNASSANLTVISADGTKIAFASNATDLITDTTTNGNGDVFLYDVATATTTLITKGSSGDGGNGWSYNPSITADGTKITFTSYATDLITDTTTNGRGEVFLYDVATGVTTLVTKGSSGNGSKGNNPSISADGTKIAFTSGATDLITDTTTNGNGNVFLYDVATGVTTLVTKGSSGIGGNSGSSSAWISGDSAKITFNSSATDLITDTTTNDNSNIFLYDVVTGVTRLITKGLSGVGADSGSTAGLISKDGTKISFTSYATDLILGTTTNGQSNVYLYDAVADTITLVTKGLPGVGANGGTWTYPSISPNGNTIMFWSTATNLIEGITLVSTANAFAYDVENDEMILLTAGPLGTGGNGATYATPYSSADGRMITFWSFADNLLETPTNGKSNIFLWVRTVYVDVVFNPANGSESFTEEVLQGEAVAEPAAPVREGFVFKGWYTEGETLWNFNNPVNGDMTLYAHWISAESPQPPPVPPTPPVEPPVKPAVPSTGDEGLDTLTWIAAIAAIALIMLLLAFRIKKAMSAKGDVVAGAITPEDAVEVEEVEIIEADTIDTD